MAFPTGYTPSEALPNVKDHMKRIKAAAQRLKADSLAGPVTVTAVAAYAQQFKGTLSQLAALAATPGLSEYAQQQYPADAGLDIVAEYQATMAAIEATRTAIVNGLPKAPGGQLLERKLDADAQTVPEVLDTGSALAIGLRAQLDSLIATIE